MTIETMLDGWLGLVGGITGVSVLLYMGLMVYYTRKRSMELQEVRVQLAEVKGILLGGKKHGRQ